MITIDKIAYILLKEKAILSTKSYGKKKYYIPGGKREESETDKDALIREVKEELDIDLVVDTIKFFGIFQAQADGFPLGKYVQMTCYTADYIGRIKPKSEIETVKWLNYENKNIISEVDKIIFDYLYNNHLLD